MYTPRAFAETDLAALDALLARDPFVTLVSIDPEGRPFASHLPVLYRRAGDKVLIEGHWARPNTQTAHSGQVLMIVHGPHGYISPSWYVDKDPAARVPTWNYAVAHLRGTLQVSGDPALLSDLVSRLTEHFEPTVGEDWRFEPQRIDHASQLGGIVAFRFVPDSISLKFKLSQNHPPANVQGAIDALQRLGGESRSAVAELMLERLRRRPDQQEG